MINRFKVLIVAIGFTLILSQPVLADKKQDYQNTYNYKRALELYREDKNDEAIDFFKREVSDHKDNGYAYAWLASIQHQEDQLGEALGNINFAIKYLDKKDDFYGFSLSLRSGLYEELEDEKKALDDLNEYVKLFPNDENAFDKRAQYYLRKDKYELAMADFKQEAVVKPNEETAYSGIAVCQIHLKMYDDAIANLNHAIKLDPSYASAYGQRAYVYVLTGKFSEAADDVAKSLDIDGNDLAFRVMQDVADSSFEDMDFKLKIKQMMQPNSDYWPYCRGIIRERSKRYIEAIEHYEASNRLKYSVLTLRRMANCKEEIGDFQGALKYVEKGLAMDSTDVILEILRQDYLSELGRTKEAIDVCTHIIELAPNHSIGYSERAQIKMDIRDFNGALEDISMALMIENDDATYYMYRGNIYLQLGNRDQALKDYCKVLEYDTIPSEYSCAYYALYELGQKENAIAAIDSVLSKDSIGNAYDAACLYSRMGDTSKSLVYLRKSLEGGYLRFYHIEHDYDLDNIRNDERYIALIEEFKTKSGYSIANAEANLDSKDSDFETIIDEIPFTHEGGVTKVKCKINDLPLHFVFDTGASDVTISSIEATFMLKNGYLSENDITGNAYYRTADGNISEGTTIILRKVELGNLVLDNVNASVVKSQKAPLLLGQSVLQRLGKIEIDNSRNVLTVSHRKKK